MLQTSSLAENDDTVKRLRNWLSTPQAGWLALAAITLLAGAIRFYRLGTESLWFDETHTWRMTQVTWNQFMFIRVLWHEEPYPPLYLTLIYGWVAWLGDSEVVLRFPSLVAGVLTIPVLGWGMGRLVGKSLGLIAALLLALSPFHIWYSQEARVYTLFALLVLLSTLALAEAWRTNRRPAWFIYGLLCLLGCYTHYYVIFYLAGQALFVVIASLMAIRKGDRDPRWRSWVITGVIAALFYLPWLPFVFQAPFGNTNWIRPWMESMPPFEQFWRTLTPVVLGTTAPFLKVRPDLVYNGLLTLLIVGLWPGSSLLGDLVRRVRWPTWLRRLLSSGQVTRASSEQEQWSLVLVAIMALVPLLLAWIASQLHPMLVPRYFLPMTPFALVLIARGVWQLRPAMLPARWSTLVVVAGIAVVLVIQVRSLSRQIDYPSRADWRGLCAYVVGQAQPGDAIVADPAYNYWPLKYYLRDRVPILFGLPTPPPGSDANDRIKSQLAPFRRLWFVQVSQPAAGPTAQAYLNANYPKTVGPRFWGLQEFARYQLQ